MRTLTEREIDILEQQGCTAEDWTAISVSDDFAPYYIRDVHFYGDIQLGVYEKSIAVSQGFLRHTGIFGATLRNVSVGDNCLIERIGNHINNYNIGDDCLIIGVSTIETTEGATFGEGTVISVLNEAGDGNVMIYSGLSSQMAAMMLRYERDGEFISRLTRMILEENDTADAIGSIGNRVRITSTQQITNCIIGDDCEIDGACRLSDCSLHSLSAAPTYIGSGVICESCIISGGSSILNSAKLENCFVGESCQIKNGFTASDSVFFANSYMSNGETCAAFCGPFSTSHHKSTLIIATACSFYNAGSATNFSNHAYKMGPFHYGLLERGVKTASCSYIIQPAKIGQFSVCFGKMRRHPDTRQLPFSYIISSEGDGSIIVPGRNIVTVGLFRDIKKWPKRDKRSSGSRLSIINFDWLSPFSVGRIVSAKRLLEEFQKVSGDGVREYNFQSYAINAQALINGISYYDLAIRMFIGEVIRSTEKPSTDVGEGEWTDLAGLLLPLSEEQRIVSDVKDGTLATTREVLQRFRQIHQSYSDYRLLWAYRLACDIYKVDEISEDVVEQIRADYAQAKHTWIEEIRKDAQKEYSLGDVSEEVLQAFLRQLDAEEQDV